MSKSLGATEGRLRCPDGDKGSCEWRREGGALQAGEKPGQKYGGQQRKVRACVCVCVCVCVHVPVC